MTQAIDNGAHPPLTLTPLALTMGEPAGIGAEITLKAWGARRERPIPPFFYLGDPGFLESVAAGMGLTGAVRVIDGPEQAGAVFDSAVPVLPIALAAPVVSGRPDPVNGAAVIASIDKAVALVRGGAAAAVVTNPIQKSALYQAGFRHTDHTDYLAALAGLSTAPVMMLEGGGVRVVPVTIHVPLRVAVTTLRTSAIVHCARITAMALVSQFGIARPRLAVAALNPHAGESGAFGGEEEEIIAPAVAVLRSEGIEAFGPRPSDTLFHAAARAAYDAVICMYHDQALIPLKTIDFNSGVNITLGLPFVRTSPDHGTALDIAGTGKASPESLIAALRTGARLSAARGLHPLEPGKWG